MQMFGQPQREGPSMAVGVKDDSGIPRSNKSDLAKYGLDVPEIIYQVRQDDEVKTLIEIQIVGVGMEKPQSRVPASGVIEHTLGKIDPHPKRRVETGQKVAGGTAQFKNTLPGRDQ